MGLQAIDPFSIQTRTVDTEKEGRRKGGSVQKVRKIVIKYFGLYRKSTPIFDPIRKKYVYAPKFNFVEMAHTNFSPLFDRQHLSPLV